MLTLRSLGGAGTVTGSKHMLSLGDQRLLVDCGLFQGLKNLREMNWQPLPVEAASIADVVLTHAHLDHSGYLPRLVNEGFRGRIHTSAATRDVAELILKDSGHLQEKDADFANRKGYSKHAPALALYTEEDAEKFRVKEKAKRDALKVAKQATHGGVSAAVETAEAAAEAPTQPDCGADGAPQAQEAGA